MHSPEMWMSGNDFLSKRKMLRPKVKDKIKTSSDSEAVSGSAFLPVESFDIIVFGATGDLSFRKLIPALFHRYCDGQISTDSRVIGVARTDIDIDVFRQRAKESYHKFTGLNTLENPAWVPFSELMDYVPIDVMSETANWAALVEALKGAEERVRVFYLAMPPRMFAVICEALKKAGLVNENSRVVLEKPLGTDFNSAQHINEGVGRVFDENLIYRIDHYLGKETVQNLLVLRFGNILLEPLWNNKAIEHIQITAAESIGVGGRGSYYDGVGALKDMVNGTSCIIKCR